MMIYEVSHVRVMSDAISEEKKINSADKIKYD